MARLKDKLVECIAINLAKEKCGDPKKSDEFLIEAELLLKQLLLDVLIERSTGDPLGYVEMLENIEEICDWDDYYVDYIENLIFWWLKKERYSISLFLFIDYR